MLWQTYPPNLKCLSSPVTEIWKASQNVENGVVWGGQESPKVTLRPISAHNVSTVGDSEKSSITTNIKSTTSFPTSHRLSAYVTPKCPKGWLKERFFRFLSKLISQRVIVSGAVNLVRQRVSYTADGRRQYWSHPPSTNVCSSYRPSRRNCLITVSCESQRQRRHLWESIREWLLVPPFTRAFLKSPSSRGLSAIAELLVVLVFPFDLNPVWCPHSSLSVFYLL